MYKGTYPAKKTPFEKVSGLEKIFYRKTELKSIVKQKHFWIYSNLMGEKLFAITLKKKVIPIAQNKASLVQSTKNSELGSKLINLLRKISIFKYLFKMGLMFKFY